MKIKWHYKPVGNCPVQSEGIFLGKSFYFRARGRQASIEFYHDKPNYCNYNAVRYVLWETEPYAAGWLNRSFCKLLIYAGCLRFLVRKILNPNN